MPAWIPSRRSAPLTGLAAAALWVSGAAADPEPVRHPPPRKPAAHAHAQAHVASRKANGHGGAHPAHPASVAGHASPPPTAAPTPAPNPVPAPPAPPHGTSTGLPLPRFAALRADSVYLRRGPGSRYPIEWVYHRRDLPVRIEREFDVWRLIEDSDGIKGWVHQATLVGTRSFVIPEPAAGPGPIADPSPDPGADAAAAAPAGGSATLPVGPPGSQVLRSAPQPDASPMAVLEPGVIGRLRSCAAGAGWCRVTVRDQAGWLPRQSVWGLLPDETIPAP